MRGPLTITLVAIRTLSDACGSERNRKLARGSNRADAKVALYRLMQGELCHFDEWCSLLPYSPLPVVPLLEVPPTIGGYSGREEVGESFVGGSSTSRGMDPAQDNQSLLFLKNKRKLPS